MSSRYPGQLPVSTRRAGAAGGPSTGLSRGVLSERGKWRHLGLITSAKSGSEDGSCFMGVGWGEGASSGGRRTGRKVASDIETTAWARFSAADLDPHARKHWGQQTRGSARGNLNFPLKSPAKKKKKEWGVS